MSTALDARKDIQTRLAVTADGIFGPKTLSAFNALGSTPDASPWPATPPGPIPTPTPGTSMVFGDSVEPLSATWFSRFKQLTGQDAKIMGRYFRSPGHPASYEYQHSVENGPAIAAGCRILCIAEQTPFVGGGAKNGATDGVLNAQDIVLTFGADYLASQGTEFLCVLDVESQPSLSAPYWTGWSAALIAESKQLSGGRFTIVPGIYASEMDGNTWKALKTALAGGATCAGAWIAAYAQTHANPRPFVPAWNPNKARMVMPDGSAPPNVPVVAWQYLGIDTDHPQGDDKLFAALDCNLTAPGQADWLLSRCVLPPG